MDKNLRRKTADFRAVADIRLAALEDGPGRGQRILIARNATGVAFEVAIDRGFDVSCLSVGGINVGWHSATQMRYPASDPGSEEGWGFLRNLDGFMVTCGLDHISRPRKVNVSHYNHPHLKTKTMPQHGRIASERARLVGYGVDPASAEVFCEGIVRQASVFGETLELRRRITLPVFKSVLMINDTVINCSFRPTHHAILYHLNYGYPFLDDGLTISGLPEPLQSEIDSTPPVPDDDFGEKVDLVDSRITPHRPFLTLRNSACGLAHSLEYNQDGLPHLAVWRAYQSGVFALAIEPRTPVQPEQGSLLLPGEQRDYCLQFRFASI
jgi:hypothetical protein